MIISERIFKIMSDRGISQSEFSSKTGISQSTISDWKRKKTNPASDKLMCICDVLGVTPYEILQDSMSVGEGVDYTITSEGTDEYFLIETYQKLGMKDKGRLLGYAEALLNKK